MKISIICFVLISSITVNAVTFISTLPNTTSTKLDFRYRYRRIVEDINSPLQTSLVELMRRIPTTTITGRTNSTNATVHHLSGNPQLQIHPLINTTKGLYYSQDSLFFSECHIHELEEASYFYQRLPRVFSKGETGIVPCLVVGSPAPQVSWFRCENKCDQPIDVAEYKYNLTKYGHLLIRNFSQSDAISYRCKGISSCGNVHPKPIKLQMQNKKGSTNYTNRVDGYIITRQAGGATFISNYDQSHGVREKDVEQTLSPYQRWLFFGNKVNYPIEVIFNGTDNIHLVTYSHFPPKPDYTDDRLNTTDYAHLELYLSSDTSLLKPATELPYLNIRFTTHLIPEPHLEPTQRSVIVQDERTYVLRFTSRKPLSHEVRGVSCFRNGVNLRNTSRTVISLYGDNTIHLVISCPLEVDTGYYQCGVQYDAFYISTPVYVDVATVAVPCVTSVGTVRNIAGDSVVLTWDNMTSTSGQSFSSPDMFVVVVSAEISMFTSLEPPNRRIIQTNQSTITISNLKPFSVYYWTVLNQSGDFLTDRLSFKTSPSLPNWKVTIKSTHATETTCTVTWSNIPPERLFDRPKAMYFRVQLLASPSSENNEKDLSHPLQRTTRVNYPAYTATGLTPLTEYFLRIEPCNTVGCADATVVSFTTTDIIFDTPPVVNVIQIYNRKIKIAVHPLKSSRTTMVRVVNFHNLEDCKGTMPESGFNTKNTTIIRTLKATYSIEELQFFTTYHLRVQTFNHQSASPWSSCLTYQTNFDYLIVIIPLLSMMAFAFVLFGMSVGIKQRYPNIVQDLKDAFHKKALYYQPGNGTEKQYDMLWDEDIEIVHMPPSSTAPIGV